MRGELCTCFLCTSLCPNFPLALQLPEQQACAKSHTGANQEGWAVLHDANAAFIVDCEVQLVNRNKLQNSGSEIMV